MTSPSRQTLVLIVNRSPETLVLLRNVIEEAGMAAIVQSQNELDADALLRFIDDHRPNLVMFDVAYPYETNLAAFRSLRTDPRGAQAAWLALSTSSSVVERLRESGECAVMGKPFDFEELMSTVAQALGGPG